MEARERKKKKRNRKRIKKRKKLFRQFRVSFERVHLRRNARTYSIYVIVCFFFFFRIHNLFSAHSLIRSICSFMLYIACVFVCVSHRFTSQTYPKRSAFQLLSICLFVTLTLNLMVRWSQTYSKFFLEGFES